MKINFEFTEEDLVKLVRRHLRGRLGFEFDIIGSELASEFRDPLNTKVVLFVDVEIEDLKRRMNDLEGKNKETKLKPRLRADYLEERMQDPEFRAAYDEWEPDFNIADTLLSFRAANHLTQEELAKLIGMNRSRLSELESASGNPTLQTLKKIATALGAKLEIKFKQIKGEELC